MLPRMLCGPPRGQQPDGSADDRGRYERPAQHAYGDEHDGDQQQRPAVRGDRRARGAHADRRGHADCSGRHALKQVMEPAKFREPKVSRASGRCSLTPLMKAGDMSMLTESTCSGLPWCWPRYAAKPSIVLASLPVVTNTTRRACMSATRVRYS